MQKRSMNSSAEKRKSKGQQYHGFGRDVIHFMIYDFHFANFHDANLGTFLAKEKESGVIRGIVAKIYICNCHM